MDKPLLVFALEQESRSLFEDFDVLYTGVGKVNAAHVLTGYLHHNPVRRVINLGTAGSAVHPPGSVLHCTRFIQRDMDATPLGFARWETPFSGRAPILEYGEAVAHVPHATCGTGDSFDITHDGSAYDVVDMEAYALAHICSEAGIPFTCLKYISDGADDDASDDWEGALEKAAVALRGALDGV